MIKWRCGFVVEADIRKCFDKLDRRLIRELLSKRVRDGVIVRLIGKWLKAGVLEEGWISHPETGVPQGGVISPLLMNIYLHEVLDKWFETEVKGRLRGRSFVVRFADDFLFGFSSEKDARRVLEVLPKRFGRFKLTLHPDKTRLISFQRPPGYQRRKPPGDSGPGTFSFLGFTHYYERSFQGYWVIKHKTAKDRFSRAMRRIAEWCRTHRHLPIAEQHRTLGLKLKGHANYYGIPGNSVAVARFIHRAGRVWRKWLARRSHKAKKSWDWFNQLLKRYPLPRPRVARWAKST